VLLGAVIPYLLRSFQKRAFPLSFLAFPLVFNFTLLMGFYSYCLAAVLFLAALAANWGIRRRPGWQRLILATGMGVALYLCHLSAFALFTGSLALLPVTQREGRSFSGSAVKGAGLALPLLVLLGSYLAQAQHGGWPSQDGLFSLGRLARLVTDFFLFSTVSLSPLQLIPLGILLGTVAQLATLRVNRWRAGQQLESSESYLLVVSGTFFIIYLAAPNGFAGGSFFNERLPWVILALALPILAAVPQANSPRWQRFLIGQACLFFLVNSWVLWSQGRAVQHFLASLAAPLPRGSCVALYRGTGTGGGPVDPLLHALAHHCLSGHYVDIGNYETQLDYFPVRFSRALPPLPTPDEVASLPQAVPWEEFPAVSYLYGVNTTGTDRLLLNRHFRVVLEKGPYSLWQRIPRAADGQARPPAAIRHPAQPLTNRPVHAAVPVKTFTP